MHKRIRQENGIWIVPSETTPSKTYRVVLGDQCSCECDFFDRPEKACKHVWAARIIRSGVSLKFANTVTRRRDRAPEHRDWVSYRLALENEEEEFLVLAHDLCSNLKTPVMRREGGRPPFELSGAIFGLLVKNYDPKGALRAKGKLKSLRPFGYVRDVPSSNTLLNYLNNPTTSAVLQRLITFSTLPLVAVEKDFAFDSSGFSTFNFEYDTDEESGVELGIRQYVKAHVACGVRTHVITAITVSDGEANDSPFFPELLRRTAENFAIRDVCADKAYTNQENVTAVVNAGGYPYMPYKRTHTGAVGGLFEKHLHEWRLHPEVHEKKYHARSNVESAFSMVKRVLRERLLSKSETALYNEVLCKFLVHNIRCLIKCRYELGSRIELRLPDARRTHVDEVGRGDRLEWRIESRGLGRDTLGSACGPSMGTSPSLFARTCAWMSRHGWSLIHEVERPLRRRGSTSEDMCATCCRPFRPSEDRFKKAFLVGNVEDFQFVCVDCAVTGFDTAGDRDVDDESNQPHTDPLLTRRKT